MAYSPSSNYRILAKASASFKKHKPASTLPQGKPRTQHQGETYLGRDRINKTLLRKCFMHPKSSHTIFECNSLRKALGAPLVKETLPKIKSTAVSISLPMNKFIMQTIAHVYEQGVGLKSQSPSLYNYCNFDKFSIKVDYLINRLLCSRSSDLHPITYTTLGALLNM